jgi:hypothetical protein
METRKGPLNCRDREFQSSFHKRSAANACGKKKEYNMKTNPVPFAAFAVAGITALIAAISLPVHARGKGNPLPQPVVYVTGQGLFYDTTVTTPLPPYGPFQKLEMGGPHGGIQTAYGPGDPEYVGGRWWVDVNGNNRMDAGDDYFGCPLHGPGRLTP